MVDIVELDKTIELFNISLSNMEAALVLVEYATKNDMPISNLAKLTIRESCEDIQNTTECLMAAIDDTGS